MPGSLQAGCAYRIRLLNLGRQPAISVVIGMCMHILGKNEKSYCDIPIARAVKSPLKSWQLCALVLISLPAIGRCEVSEEVTCFDNSDAKSRNFGLYVIYDDVTKWSGAFVKYRDGTSVITLVLKNEDSEEISPGRPDQVTTTWYEVYGGKITGEYETMSQGANVYSMTYKNYGTRKQVAFLFNPEAKNGTECAW
jgi:hypothetical protein